MCTQSIEYEAPQMCRHQQISMRVHAVRSRRRRNWLGYSYAIQLAIHANHLAIHAIPSHG